MGGLTPTAGDIPEDKIVYLNIPTGMPLVYEPGENFRSVDRYYLSDPELVKKAMAAVANQGKAESPSPA